MNKTKKPNAATRFFWWTAGADQEILLRSTHSDRVKYLTLGGIILATGVMAALAGGYAFYTIFAPKGDALDTYVQVNNTSIAAVREQTDVMTAFFALIFGLIWGLIIFNIDRFIVTSTGIGDGTESITWSEFKGAIPRIVMGAIIAITISKPVEIRMFKSEIDAELHIRQQKQASEYEKETRAKYQVDLNRISAEKDKIENQRNDLKDQIKQLDKEYIDQLQGRKAAGAGDGPLAKAIMLEISKKQQLLNTFDKDNNGPLQKLKTEEEKLLTEQAEDLTNNVKVASGLDGLLERIKITHDIAGIWITLFITLLFMAIELTPIFFKLMLIKSPYDYLLENEKELVKARSGIHIEYNYYSEADHPEKEGIERHLVRFLETEKVNLERIELLEVQKRLTLYAISKFEEQQKNLIDKNPEQYIAITTPTLSNEHDKKDLRREAPQAPAKDDE